jgi:hypothetical protein
MMASSYLESTRGPTIGPWTTDLERGAFSALQLAVANLRYAWLESRRRVEQSCMYSSILLKLD